MISLFKRICKLNAKKVFYKNGHDYITYEKLWKEACLLSLKLPNDKSPVIVCGHKQTKMLVSFLACLINGNPYVPVDVFNPKKRIDIIIRESKAKYIINNASEDYYGLINVLKCKDKKEINFSNNLDDIAYIIFTSGSTGVPKGVAISKENLFNFIIWINNVIPKQNNMVVFNQASFSFDLSVADIYFSMSNGFTLIAINSDYDLEKITETIIHNKVNVMVATPTFIKMCLQSKKFNIENIPSLKTIFLCGERLEKKVVSKLLNRFNELNVINAYGPTEATCAISSVMITDNFLNDKILPVGKVNSSAVDVLIEDDEIVLKGKSVSKGYINIKSDKFGYENDAYLYKTGDLGCIKNGYLYCLGRKDNQIKYKGYRIELEEIEEVLISIDNVDDGIVVSKKNDEGKVNAIVCFVKGTNLSPKYIKEKLGEKLPDYMIPKFVKIIDEIPIGVTHKHDRKELMKNV